MKKLFIIFSLIFGFICFADTYAKQGNSAIYSNKHAVMVVATDYYDVSDTIRERYDLILSEDVMKIHYKSNFEAIEKSTKATGWGVTDYIKYNGEDKDITRVRVTESPEYGSVAVKFVGNKQIDNVKIDGDTVDLMLLFGKYDIDTAWNKIKQKYKD